jgi:predicted lipid-binding transport protein (Tim44 family)
MFRLRFRRVLPFFAAAAVLFALVADADARAGGGLSFGSRGMRTFTPPAATRTIPGGASPIQRSMTEPGASPSVPYARPGLFGSGMFGRGLFGGLLGGFLGAGLLGMLFGYGLFGGFLGFGSLIGLLLQIAVIYLVARWVWGYFQRRQSPAYAGPSMFRGLGSGLGGPSGGTGASPRAPADGGPIRIGPADYDAFERLLGEVQSAYSAENLEALRAHVTPEMLSYFAEQLAENASRGVVNRISDVKLVQGDLAEAWREGGREYASVAMRFSLIDRTVERATGRVVEGSETQPTEATELWTFLRASYGSWVLSAIQQA